MVQQMEKEKGEGRGERQRRLNRLNGVISQWDEKGVEDWEKMHVRKKVTKLRKDNRVTAETVREADTHTHGHKAYEAFMWETKRQKVIRWWWVTSSSRLVPPHLYFPTSQLTLFTKQTKCSHLHLYSAWLTEGIHQSSLLIRCCSVPPLSFYF